MKKLELDCNNDNEILNIITDIILKRHPIVDNRLNELLEYPRTAMDIVFDFCEIEDKHYTRISFIDGTDISKYSMPEQLIINNLVSTKILCDLIHYILDDHNYIKNISIQDNFISLSFDVNMDGNNISGISCGDINLNLNVSCVKESNQLFNYYLRNIISNFYDKLKDTKCFKNEYNKYCSFVKENIINSMDGEELHNFIDLLDDSYLRNMLHGISNDDFVELYNNFQKYKIKKKINCE